MLVRASEKTLAALKRQHAGERQSSQDPVVPAPRRITVERGWVPARERSASLISVVIPSYNHAQFIRQAIRSIADQTYKNVELIIIDDGSSDSSIDVIAQTLREVEVQNVIFQQQENRGAHDAINNGILLSHGEYICILNSDDYFDSARLGKLLGFVTEEGKDFAFTEVNIVEEHQASQLKDSMRAWLRELDNFPTLGFSLLRFNGTTSSSNFFFSAKLVERIGLFRDFTFVHDWDFVLRALRDGEPGILREPLLNYRVHPGGTIAKARSADLAQEQYRAVLTDYFREIQGRFVPNPVAPSPNYWPGTFEKFVADEDFLNRYTLALPSPWSVWESTHTHGATTPSPTTDPLTPPFELIELVGSMTAEQFHAVGQEFFGYFVDLGLIAPDHYLLDVGCGSGRMAIPLTQFLSPIGRYSGFDVVPSAIDWCSSEISARYSNFEFYVADVRNTFYNPDSPVGAGEYRFPHDDASFDFVFLTSVFTHMLPPDMEHYVSEISRVLKPGGRCLSTFFLANEESSEHIEADKSTVPFHCLFENYRTISLDSPEFAVCYDEQFALDMFSKHGLNVTDPIRYGSWCGRNYYTSYQDLIVAVKQ